MLYTNWGPGHAFDSDTPIQRRGRLQWLELIRARDAKAYAKCLARILELSEQGFDMRRPHADYLRDGIYELRATTRGIHYPMLYFFYEQNVVALSHGLTKEAAVPAKEIELALSRMELVKKLSTKYTEVFEVD